LPKIGADTKIVFVVVDVAVRGKRGAASVFSQGDAGLKDRIKI
jgi:hypothetical protein